MNLKETRLFWGLVVAACGSLLWGQQPGVSETVIVPRLVQFSGVVNESAVKPVAGITFALYKDQSGGAPIWIENQNVPLDESGRYTVLLGATKGEGLPLALFTSGEARWLGVQPEGQPEQPRVLLLSVPYALKAGDAETVGGLPPSAFVLAVPDVRGATTDSVKPADTTATGLATLSGSGTLDFLPLWTPNGSTLGNSIVFQNASSNIGIGTQTPGAKLDVAGSAFVRGLFTLPPVANATSSAGQNSQALCLQSSSFSSATNTAVTEKFRWVAEPVGNDTSTPSGKLNLLFGAGSNTPSETGLSISSGGVFTFAPGQTFPSVGTITGVKAGTDLTGGGTSGTVTLNLDTTKVPQLNATNTFNGSQTINGQLLGQTAVFIGANSGAILQATQNNGTNGTALAGIAGGTTGVGVSGSGFTGVSGVGLGNGTGVSGTGSVGVSGSGTAAGLLGTGTSTNSQGVVGLGQLNGVQAIAGATSGKTQGLLASAASPTGTGSLSFAVGESKTGTSLFGCCAVGVWGDTNQTTPGAAALVGTADDAQALVLANNSTTHLTASIKNFENTTHSVELLNVTGTFGSCAMDSDGTLNCTGSVNATSGVSNLASTIIFGNLSVTGNVSKGSGSFKIDHPLAPESKYLYHSFVESPDMMNIYNGNVTTDSRGFAEVVLPDYFEALNRDFRYQLTVMGQFAQAIVASEVNHNRFTIQTSHPDVRVSWQVTGIRQDAYANSHRIQVEEDKPPQERGKYLHPELFGAPAELAIGARSPSGVSRRQF